MMNDLDALNDERNPARTHHGAGKELHELTDEEIQEGLQKLEDHANTGSSGSSGSLFNADKDKDSGNKKQSRLAKGIGGMANRFKKASSAKKALMAGGLGAALIGGGASFIGLMGFMNVFRLDHLISNIEAKAFIRYQVDMDGRSSKWINSYLMLRMGEVDSPELAPGDRDNIIFRADRVDNNNPLNDWYKTMRASKFEQDLLENQGIKFVSVAYRDGNQVKYRPGVITIGDERLTFNPTEAEIKAIENGEINNFNGRLQQFVDIERLDNDKEARKRIKAAVNANTKSYQVMKRYYLRKSIQNMTGVRSWKIFENKRQAAREGVRGYVNGRLTLLTSALPEGARSGKIITCLFGLAECRGSTDANNPENRADSAVSGASCADTPKPSGCETNAKDESTADNPDDVIQNDGSAEAGLSEGTSGGISNKVLQQIISKINPATSIISLIDTLNRIDKSMGDESLSKLVYSARLSQAIGMFTALSIARDQSRSGENLNSQELGNLVASSVDGAGMSEGWNRVIDDDKASGSVSAASYKEPDDKAEYCSTKNQDAMLLPQNAKAAESTYHYLCDSQKIGSADLAKTIESGWNESIGTALAPVFEIYNRTGIGNLISMVEGAVDAALKPIVSATLKSLGLEDNVESLAAWATVKAAKTLGAGPQVEENSPSAVLINQGIQGAAAAAETGSRFQGAALTNPDSAARASRAVAAYKAEEASEANFVEKYASLSNSQSLFSNALFNASAINSQTLFSSMFGALKNFPGALVNSRANAAGSNTGYEVAKWAGVNTYDFSQQCIDSDPLTATPASSTNADDLGLINASELTWELVQDSDALYGKLYEAHPERGDDIEKVESCAVLDSTIRGSMAALYDQSQLGPNALQTGSDSVAGDVTSGVGAKFRISSFNILYSTADKGAPWSERLDRSSGVINSQKIDVVGLQEVRQNQWERLQENLPDYDIYPDPYSAGGYGAQNPIMWHTCKFKLIGAGTKAIPGYTVLGKYDKKAAIQVKLEALDANCQPTGQYIYVINSHETVGNGGVSGADYSREEARLKSAQLRAEYVKNLADEGVPIFLTADWNAKYTADNPNQKTVGNTPEERKNNLSYCVLTADTGLWDAYDAWKQKTGACPNYGGIPEGDGPRGPVDHIYMSSSVKATHYEYKIGPPANGSDSHRTLIADVEVPGSAESTNGGAELNVATLNIFHSDEQKESVWKARLKKTVDTLTSNQVDVAGLQEVRPNQNVAFRQNDFGGSVYELYPAANKTGAGFSPNTIIWNKEKFTRDTTDIPPPLKIKYFDGLSRTVPIVKLIYKETGQAIYVANTHDPADVRGEASQHRLNNALKYKTYFANLATKSGLPIIFTGDFNSRYDVIPGNSHNDPYQNKCENLTYRILSKAGVLRDAYDLSVNRGAPACPSPASTPSTKNSVDHIYMSSSMQVSSFKNLGDKGQSKNGSDSHDTIVARAVIANTNTSASTPANGDTVSTSGWTWPIAKKDYTGISQCWNSAGTGLGRHAGLDVGLKSGTQLYAAHDGVVEWNTFNTYAGYNLLINAGNGLWYNYQHMTQGSSRLKAGDKVTAGQPVGKSGETGRAYGAHLHFGVSVYRGVGSYSDNSQTRDPLNYLPKDRETGGC